MHLEMAKQATRPEPGEARSVLGPARHARLENRTGPSKSGGRFLVRARSAYSCLVGPLIRAVLGSGPNNGLRVGLAGLMLISHQYMHPIKLV